jgi:hypothetical protein
MGPVPARGPAVTPARYPALASRVSGRRPDTVRAPHVSPGFLVAPAAYAYRSVLVYPAAPGRREILLTVFPKTRSAETAEVARALHAQKICEAEHGTAHQVFDREVN